MYRGFPFSKVSDVLLHQMKWEWMLLSFVPGIMAQVFRGLRWHQSLSPIGERSRISHCVYAVFVSYAASLVIPRIGEFVRCGILMRHDNIDFPKALGTVVTERVVDTVLVLLTVLIVFLSQLHVFSVFFDMTGMSIEGTISHFTGTGIFVTIACATGIAVLLFFLFRRLTFIRKVRSAFHGLIEGLLSIRNISNVPLYIFYSIGIWVAYFLHYFLTFYCFDFTKDVGFTAGLVSFCVGTIAVIVPTPNGAGPWHFAVKTILVLYGLSASNAIMFALIVHSVQTLLLVVLGIYALFMLSFHTPLKSRQNTKV